MTVRYRHRDGHVVTYSQPRPNLDADGRWDRVGEQPSTSDLKSVWADYARSQGVDPDGLTKWQIIEACGGHE